MEMIKANEYVHTTQDLAHTTTTEPPLVYVVPTSTETVRATALLLLSAFGLLGNTFAVLLGIAVKKLRKSQNSFFIHHCVLDAAKSIYCLVYSKSLLDGVAVSSCVIFGATYFVLVTTSAFNILAITINEIYHFINRVEGVESRNGCCAAFGIAITWFTSIIINLGVAFLPGKPTNSKKVEYCSYMYGVTGNYFLHLLWVILISLSLFSTTIYLRKFWASIEKKRRNKGGTKKRKQLRGDYTALLKNRRVYREVLRKALSGATKNLRLLTIMMVSFILFWYPLLVLTLVDPDYNVHPVFYKTLTVLAWSNSILSPVFFILYNSSYFEKVRSRWEIPSAFNSLRALSPETNSSEGSGVSKNPQRPNSLDVKPAYVCNVHLESGHCKTTADDQLDRSSSSADDAGNLCTNMLFLTKDQKLKEKKTKKNRKKEKNTRCLTSDKNDIDTTNTRCSSPTITVSTKLHSSPFEKTLLIGTKCLTKSHGKTTPCQAATLRPSNNKITRAPRSATMMCLTEAQRRFYDPKSIASNIEDTSSTNKYCYSDYSLNKKDTYWL